MTTVYDAAGQTTATIDPLDNDTTYFYDALGRQIEVLQPAPGVEGENAPYTLYTYDAVGNVLTTRGRPGRHHHLRLRQPLPVDQEQDPDEMHAKATRPRFTPTTLAGNRRASPIPKTTRPTTPTMG